MPTIHLMVGFIGFGKTTIAKQLAKKLPAVRLTHDEFMVKLYGRSMPYADFHPNYDKVDAILWNLAEKIVKAGTDVIMDYGFWSHDDRKKVYERAKKITDSVVFHCVYYDMVKAKSRIVIRSAQDLEEMFIQEEKFDRLSSRFEAWSNDDKYPVIFHYSDNNVIYSSAFNRQVTKMHFGIYGSIIQNGKILLVKKARGPYTGLYDLPGGEQEKGETYHETLYREIREETGCKVVKVENERFKSIIFSDFTAECGEKGVLQHEAILYDVEIEGEPKANGDGLDSDGALWVDIKDLTAENSTPFALMAANKPLIAVADENDETVSTHLRGTPIKPNRYPMIAGVLLFNSKGNLILQKIASHKEWGGLWTYSAAGHVDADEDYATAAKRELKEELGIEAEIEREVAAFPVIREGKKVAYHHIFAAHSDEKIIPDKSEVAEIREISLADLQNEIAQNPERFFDAFLTTIKIYMGQRNV